MFSHPSNWKSSRSGVCVLGVGKRVANGVLPDPSPRLKGQGVKGRAHETTCSLGLTAVLTSSNSVCPRRGEGTSYAIMLQMISCCLPMLFGVNT